MDGSTPHMLSEEDLIIQNNIHELMCQGRTMLNASLLDADFLATAFSKLKRLEEDRLVEVMGNVIFVTAKGNLFIRNICAAIDAQLYNNQLSMQTFSKAI